MPKQLYQVGKIAQKHWQEIPEHFDEIDIDEYVIMPNHVHGIILINKTDKPRRDVAWTRSLCAAVSLCGAVPFRVRKSFRATSLPTMMIDIKQCRNYHQNLVH